MWNENGDRNKFYLDIALRTIVLFALIAVGMVGCPRYKVYNQQMTGAGGVCTSRAE